MNHDAHRHAPPGPSCVTGDLWPSPDDEDECIEEPEPEVDLDNLAAMYADAPPDNDLSLHDDHLHRVGVARRPWWRHAQRVQWPHPGVIAITAACRPAEEDD